MRKASCKASMVSTLVYFFSPSLPSSDSDAPPSFITLTHKRRARPHRPPRARLKPMRTFTVTVTVTAALALLFLLVALFVLTFVLGWRTAASNRRSSTASAFVLVLVLLLLLVSSTPSS